MIQDLFMICHEQTGQVRQHGNGLAAIFYNKADALAYVAKHQGYVIKTLRIGAPKVKNPLDGLFGGFK